jgi:type IV secretory pathway VirB10-like protein
MDTSPAPSHAGLPPRDPRGPRLRRWIPILCLLTGLGLLGWIVGYVFRTEPPAQRALKVEPPAKDTRRSTPQTFAELEAAAQQPEANGGPPPTVPAPDEALLRELKELRLKVTALEAVQKAPAAKPDKAAEEAARREAAERRKKAEDEAKKRAQEDAEAKKARVIWERKSDRGKDGIGQLTTVASPYTLMPGWKVPCALEKAISSHHPGPVVAWVRQNVYDSVTGQHLLIPQGARLIGTSSGGQVFGDQSLTVRFGTMVVENRIYGLGQEAAEDVTGQPGLADQSDHFWGRALLSVVLTSVLRGGVTAGTGLNGNIGEAMAGQVVQQAANIGGQRVQQLINISPRITIRQGFLCSMTVVKPVSFAKPYL